MAFFLLIAALLLFVVSTRQWALWQRGLVWGTGMALLVIAWVSLGNSERDPELGMALRDFGTKFLSPGDSMLLRMLDANKETVANIILSLFDIFFFFAIIVAILALIAFQPGERMEKALRPLMIGMIGAILGGLGALAIVGTGFGEGEQRRAYATQAQLDTVFAPDTLIVNGDALRLRDIQTLLPGQLCRSGENAIDCNAEAIRGVRNLLEGSFVMCALPDETAGRGASPPPNADIRIATCSAVRANGQQIDVARAVVEEGLAIPVGAAYAAEARAATELNRGLYRFCLIKPAVWADMTQAQRAAFAERGAYPEGGDWREAVMGDCPAPMPTRRAPPQRRQPPPEAAIAAPQ